MSPRKKGGFPPSFDELRAMGNTPPPSHPVEKAVEAARFHRHVEQGALAAWAAILKDETQGARGTDLRFVDPQTVEQWAKAAWNWGLVFAEARNPKQ